MLTPKYIAIIEVKCFERNQGLLTPQHRHLACGSAGQYSGFSLGVLYYCVLYVKVGSLGMIDRGEVCTLGAAIKTTV